MNGSVSSARPHTLYHPKNYVKRFVLILHEKTAFSSLSCSKMPDCRSVPALRAAFSRRLSHVPSLVLSAIPEYFPSSIVDVARVRAGDRHCDRMPRA